VPSLESELKNAYRSGKVIIGSKKSLKALKQGKGRLLVIAANAEPRVKSEAKRLSAIAGIPVIEYSGTSSELGYALGKPFPVQMMLVMDFGESRLEEFVQA